MVSDYESAALPAELRAQVVEFYAIVPKRLTARQVLQVLVLVRCRLLPALAPVPDHLKDQVKAVLRAAFRLPAAEGMARLEKQAQWLEREYPDAAASLREGLEEMFTLNRLGLSPALMRCLSSTNVIESPHSGVRLRTRRICRWRDGRMVLRWAAAAFLLTEKSFRRIQGYRDLWMLKAALDENPGSLRRQVA